MTNFKSGSGNLDFGAGSEESEEEDDEVENGVNGAESAEPRSEAAGSGADGAGGQSDGDAAGGASADSTAPAPAEKYPYFVRRSNVGDERGTRLEIHVRDEVAKREGEFRGALAEELDTNEVAKTDAREFALLAAYRNPERVAELMREEGFGALD